MGYNRFIPTIELLKSGRYDGKVARFDSLGYPWCSYTPKMDIIALNKYLMLSPMSPYPRYQIMGPSTWFLSGKYINGDFKIGVPYTAYIVKKLIEDMSGIKEISYLNITIIENVIKTLYPTMYEIIKNAEPLKRRWYVNHMIINMTYGMSPIRNDLQLLVYYWENLLRTNMLFIFFNDEKCRNETRKLEDENYFKNIGWEVNK